MTREILIVAAALALALGGTPVARRLAHQFGVLDQPNARKVHVKPTPLLGGVAIYSAFVLALLFLGDRFYVNQVVGIFVGASFVSFLGLVDDSRGLHPLIKLGGQIVAALILVLSGVYADIFPGNGLDVALTVLWVVGITNAMNLLDNMDGLSGGLAAIAAAFFMVLAGLSHQYLVGALAAALAGACAGFLVHNWNPAHIFMGDTGSMALGGAVAAAAVILNLSLLVPIVGFIYFAESLSVIIQVFSFKVFKKRVFKMSPIHHHFELSGWKETKVVKVFYLVTIVLCCIGIFAI